MPPRYSEEIKRRAAELHDSLAARAEAGVESNHDIAARLKLEFNLAKAPCDRRIWSWSKDERYRWRATTEEEAADSIEEAILALRRGRRKMPADLATLCDRLDRGPTAVKAAIERLRERSVLIELDEAGVISTPATPPEIETPHEITPTAISEGVHRVRFGVTGDWHVGHEKSRPDVIKAFYEECARQKIKDVYHTGNILEGKPLPRINLNELAPGGHTLDGQITLLMAALPEVGVTTHFVTGDCHEGWWIKDTGFDVGKYIEDRFRDAGREDIKSLGFLRRDIVYACPRGDCVVRVFHPGGGSAYALSYAPQKIVEAMQGGEKPNVLLLGHYHKAEYLPAYRNVHVLQAGCCCDASTFLAKKRIQVHVGAWIVEMLLDDTGVIRTFSPTFYPFFDRGFYLSRRVEVKGADGVRRSETV